MEEIITQRFVYSSIDVYTNYSKLPREVIVKNFDGYEYTTNDVDWGAFSSDFENIPLNKRNRQYFKINEGSPQRFLKKMGRFYTTKERHIKKHYGNPFSDINVYTYERKIKITDDKVTISLYQQIKIRHLNRIFFKKNISIYNITIDRKKGDITCYSKTKNKIFRKNFFPTIGNLIPQIFDFGMYTLKQQLSGINEYIHNEAIKIFRDDVFYNKIGEIIGGDFTVREKTNNEYLLRQLIKYFVNKKNIKVPDNYHKLIQYWYPTEKFLKKNDRKLISSILDKYNVKSKYTIKLLHDEKYFVTIDSIIKLCLLFGENYSKYISSINTKVFIPPKNHISEIRTLQKNHWEDLSKVLTNKDKETIVSLINSKVTHKVKKTEHAYWRSSVFTVCLDKSFMDLLHDHLTMLGKIREYFPEYVLRCTHTQYFDAEHTDMSTIVGKINKGWTVKYLFNETMIFEIEKPILLEFDVDGKMISDYLYPHILKTEEEYVEEGEFMHHCVRTYSEKEKSIIISIRTKEQKDRVTCEFDCQTGRLLQARHFCNGEPPADFMLAVEEVRKRTIYFSSRGMLHSTEKIKVPIIINGVEVIPPKVKSVDGLLNILIPM